MNITTNNYRILLPLLIIILVGLICLLIIKKFRDKQLKIILIFQLSFLVTYFPIMERMSIWNWSIWTEDFNFPISNDFKADFYYTAILLLTWSSIILFYTSVILFISEINERVAIRWTRIMNWIPLVNLYSLPTSISKITGNRAIDKLIIGIWILTIALWIIFRFLGLILCLIGLDIYSQTYGLISGQNVNSSTSLHDCTTIMNILTPPLLYISAVFSLIVAIRIKKITGANNKYT